MEKIFTYIENTGKSKYLRDLGKTCRNNMKRYINIIDTSQNFSLSLNLSAIQNNVTVNESINQSTILEQSAFPAINESAVLDKPMRKKKDLEIDMDLLRNLRIEDILRALTSKIYKHQKS